MKIKETYVGIVKDFENKGNLSLVQDPEEARQILSDEFKGIKGVSRMKNEYSNLLVNTEGGYYQEIYGISSSGVPWIWCSVFRLEVVE